MELSNVLIVSLGPACCRPKSGSLPPRLKANDMNKKGLRVTEVRSGEKGSVITKLSGVSG